MESVLLHATMLFITTKKEKTKGLALQESSEGSDAFMKKEAGSPMYPK